MYCCSYFSVYIDITNVSLIIITFFIFLPSSGVTIYVTFISVVLACSPRGVRVVDRVFEQRSESSQRLYNWYLLLPR
jgi:hypothetical protein